MRNNHLITFSLDENIYKQLASFAKESNVDESTLVQMIISSYCIDKLTNSHNSKAKREAKKNDKETPLLKKFKGLLEKYKIRQIDLSNIFHISQASISRGLTGEKNVLFKTIHKYKDEYSLEYYFIAKHYLDILLQSYNEYKEKVENLQDINEDDITKLIYLSYNKDINPAEYKIIQYVLGYFYREYQDELEGNRIGMIAYFIGQEKANGKLYEVAMQYENDNKLGFALLFEYLTKLNERFDITFLSK
jgi:hypothetical protein